ncbi:MAG: chemotaxis protein CheD [Coriobacteriia bacterium]|nr:chemotaxis protein CheD [Coriobacteriia bacterium]
MSTVPEEADAAPFPVDSNRVEVGVGALALGRHPFYLMTPALGSCVAVGLWDVSTKQGALAHVMMARPFQNTPSGMEARFASHAVPEMARLLAQAGSPTRRLVAKIAGGAAMFRAEGVLASIGDRNVAEIKKQLELLRIPLHAEDTGERHARTVELHLDSGLFVVRSYLYGVKRL